MLEDLSVREEILVLLRSYYPEVATTAQVKASMSRRKPETVRRVMRDLWKDKLVEGNATDGYKLTQRGLIKAIDISERYAKVHR